MSDYIDMPEKEMLDETGIYQETIESEREQKTDANMIASLEGKTVYRIRMVHSNATEYCICAPELSISPRDNVIVPTKYGKDLGEVQGIIRNLEEIGSNAVFTLQKKASESDIKLYNENRDKDRKAFLICKEKIEGHKLDMKLISAHYLLDEPKILFFFTADTRVDFRELVKDLVSIFKSRIELRQIGVRDETRVQGGIGMCGRMFCCNSITDKLKPVSIKMAKEQNLSLNSLKISGACGRLLCCLAYEYSFYKEMRSSLPNVGEKIFFNKNDYYISDINIFKKKVLLSRNNEENVNVEFDRLIKNEKTNKWEIIELPAAPKNQEPKNERL
jgi:cell fate regulator YaaT (PSP1 superfamily)